MKLLSEEQIKNDLKSAFWDTPIDTEKLYEAIKNQENDLYPINKNVLFARLLISMEWYTLLKTVPRNKWNDMFSEKAISMVWPKSLQRKFTYAGNILLRKTLSTSG